MYDVYIDIMYNNELYKNLKRDNSYTEKEINDLKKNVGDDIDCYVNIVGNISAECPKTWLLIVFLLFDMLFAWWFYIFHTYKLETELLKEVDREEKEFLDKMTQIF